MEPLKLGNRIILTTYRAYLRYVALGYPIKDRHHMANTLSRIGAEPVLVWNDDREVPAVDERTPVYYQAETDRLMQSQRPGRGANLRARKR